jgi:beta-galactosidase
MPRRNPYFSNSSDGWAQWQFESGILLAVAALAILIVSSVCNAQSRPATPSQTSGLLLGTAWYPEQWPETRWDTDLILMERAGIHMVRVGEFAWSRMEPEEGHFDLDWLQRSIEKAQQHRIVVVIGTPTAAPPAWLTQKYPETLRVDENGRRAEHGNRQQFSFTDTRYRQLCGRMAEELAKRFGHNPDVVGWQIDNEYAEVSYDDFTRRKFQDWLKEKFGSLDSLNEHWTTSYWSQTYTDWSQIPIPRKEGNPGLKLAWMQFVSDTWRDYQRNQVEVIRSNSDPRQFITTNMMGWFEGFDHYVVAKDLTFASWDDYVGQGQLDPARNGMTHDLTRGFKHQNFWVMETQPGAVNWAPINTYLNKGEVRAMAWQAFGHGADAVSYWQWRSALNGQEQYHGTLIAADGTPVPLYEEVSQIGQDLAKLGNLLIGTSPKSQIAMLQSYDSRWAIDWQKHNRNYDQIRVFESYYKSLRALSHSLDVINPYDPLDSYKLVVAPNLNVIPDDLAQRLADYVHEGGHLVLGPRSGMKDQYNSLLTERQPGKLVGALGGRVEQFYALDEPVSVSGKLGTGRADLWAEQLSTRADDCQTLLSYDRANGWLDHQPAIVTHVYGKGRISYIGAPLDETLMDSAARWMIESSKVEPIFGPVPASVEVCRRTGNGKEVFVLINYSRENRHVTLPRSMKEALSGNQLQALDLAGYGVAILTP